MLSTVLKPGDWAVDATVGNGHDTLWLAQQVGPQGCVFGFDVQEAALAAATRRLEGFTQVSFYQCGHEHLATRLPPTSQGRITAVMFNLGYLPGTTHDIKTCAPSTLAALDQALDFLAIGGIITLILYPGHTGGAEEAAAVRSRSDQLSPAFVVTRHVRLNARAPAPELIAIARRT
jgi:predicted methyltransferase